MNSYRPLGSSPPNNRGAMPAQTLSPPPNIPTRSSRQMSGSGLCENIDIE